MAEEERSHPLHRVVATGRDFGTVDGCSRCALRRPDRLQETRQLCCRLVLGYWLKFLERTGESVRQAPHGSRLEFLMHGLKVEIMHSPREVLGKPSLLLDERLVDQQFCRSC